MPAYSELYIEGAQNVLAGMFHYAVCDMELEPDRFMFLFCYSGAAHQFETGNPKYVAGMSGSELAAEVMLRVTGEIPAAEPACCLDRSDAWWAGYTLAYYQWLKAQPFEDIRREASVSDIIRMYGKYHEMDIRQSVDEIDRIRRLSAYHEKISEHTGLHTVRKACRMTQRELADRSGVPLRTIQQYEQGQKDISRAAFATVRAMADALHCRPEELLRA